MKYRFSYSGVVDIEAETQDEAEKEFFAMSNSEIGYTIEKFDEVSVVELGKKISQKHKENISKANKGRPNKYKLPFSSGIQLLELRKKR